jgi:hypothetical protein
MDELRAGSNRPPKSWADDDPDVKRCRLERKRRANRVDPQLVEAERAFAAQIQRDKDAKRAGRPRKVVR